MNILKFIEWYDITAKFAQTRQQERKNIIPTHENIQGMEEKGTSGDSDVGKNLKFLRIGLQIALC